ncbi:PHP domain-containing protein [bacterium]|nr:PHP domain-containing protein [bacterium]MCP5462411.1 PHP domain-containing protein [bacterium]
MPELPTYIDLHIHTTKSDGLCSPYQIMEMAHELNLAAISITDHDTVEGYLEAVIPAQQFGIELISGIEFSCTEDGQDIHVLGYFVDTSCEALSEHLKNMRTARKRRFRQIVEVLNTQGIPLDADVLLEKLNNTSPGRLHIARSLIEIGKVHTVQEAFQRYLGEQCPAYVSTAKISVSECIKLIHSIRGLAILAHPGLYKNDTLITRFVGYGIDGIEAYHSNHTKTQVRKYLAMAQEKNLKISGGSDFHALNSHEPLSLGSLKLPYSILETLKQSIN